MRARKWKRSAVARVLSGGRVGRGFVWGEHLLDSSIIAFWFDPSRAGKRPPDWTKPAAWMKWVHPAAQKPILRRRGRTVSPDAQRRAVEMTPAWAEKNRIRMRAVLEKMTAVAQESMERQFKLMAEVGMSHRCDCAACQLYRGGMPEGRALETARAMGEAGMAEMMGPLSRTVGLA